MNIKWVGSPNYDKSRKPIDRVVIHWMYGRLMSADSTFQQPYNPVTKKGGTSAHYGIAGNTVHQYVDEAHTAYHAGNLDMNRRSIGIEHEAHDNYPATEETYKTSGALVKEICNRYNIPIDRQHILKHSEVVSTRCCGTVDIDKIISYAKQSSSLPIPPTNMTDLERKKLVQFDRTVIELNNAGYIGSAASEQFFDNPMDEDKFTNLIKRIIRDAKTNATPVDTAAIKELGRKEGVKQVQDIVSKIT